MKVRAIKPGFHVTLRQPGDEFEMEGKLPNWCEKVGRGAEKEPSDEEKPISQQTVNELKETATGLGIDVPAGAKKAEIQTLIGAHLAGKGSSVKGAEGPAQEETPADNLPDA